MLASNGYRKYLHGSVGSKVMAIELGKIVVLRSPARYQVTYLDPHGRVTIRPSTLPRRPLARQPVVKYVRGVSHLNYRRKKSDSPIKANEAGFSLLELLIVCVILVIVSAIAIPNIMQANANYKLDGAGHAVASLLQQARMQAVKTNQPAYANYNSNNVAFVTGDPANAYVSGNPDVAVASGLSFQAVPPNHDQLDAYLGGNAPQIGGSIGFNARGLPCTAGTNVSVCPSVTAGIEWFIQNSGVGGWEAVTVTPAGRIKSWRLSKTSGGNAMCGYTACWQ